MYIQFTRPTIKRLSLKQVTTLRSGMAQNQEHQYEQKLETTVNHLIQQTQQKKELLSKLTNPVSQSREYILLASDALQEAEQLVQQLPSGQHSKVQKSLANLQLEQEQVETLEAQQATSQHSIYTNLSRPTSQLEADAIKRLLFDLVSKQPSTAKSAEKTLKKLHVSDQTIQQVKEALYKSQQRANHPPRFSGQTNIRFSGFGTWDDPNIDLVEGSLGMPEPLFGQVLKEITDNNSSTTVVNALASHHTDKIMDHLAPVLFGGGCYFVDHYEKGYPVLVWSNNC